MLTSEQFKITDKELEEYTLVSMGRASAVTPLLEGLKVGEKGFMPREEWKESGYKTPFPYIVYNMVRKEKTKNHALHGRLFRIYTYEEGWSAERTE